jgi:single-stranded-DNA-specific exonuclease
VITVDCGIRSPNEASHAHHLGIDMIISDHHEPTEDLPFALAVICPKQPGDRYPEKNLAGVGLAYKICEGLLMRRLMPEVHLEEWLDLVAVGTVADIVPLTGENRSLGTRRAAPAAPVPAAGSLFPGASG